MAFSTDLAKLVTDQLSRFVTLNRHQLAGQVTNLDFWLAEVRHALDVLDGYHKRFQQLKAGQSKHVSQHHTIKYDLDDPVSVDPRAPLPQRVPDSELKEVRRSLIEATYRLLIRFFNDELIPESVVREACTCLNIEIDANDLKQRQKRTK
jgi:hypothetical protein